MKCLSDKMQILPDEMQAAFGKAEHFFALMQSLQHSAILVTELLHKMLSESRGNSFRFLLSRGRFHLQCGKLSEE